MQQLTCKMVSSFSFLFSKKTLILREVLGEKFRESVKSVEKCEEVQKRFCPSVVAL